MQPEKNQITDEVSVAMTRGREVTDKTLYRANVHAILRGPDGKIKYQEKGENLVTDYGDDMLATRTILDAIEIVTGMKLGTGATAAAKNGAGATLVTYYSSQQALDAVASEATKGAGAGWRITYVTTWAAGVATNAAIAEVVLTNETPLTDVDSQVGDVVARYVFGATIDKQAGDSLEVTWNIDFLGA